MVWELWRRPPALRFTVFQLPKRRGGHREIAAPSRGLRALQSKLAQVLTAVYQPRESVHGFVSGRSIKTNAAPHAGQRYLLSVDIEDFFPSIHFGRVYGLLQSWPYKLNREVATTLAQICTGGRTTLPQGAPTSPVVSNMICAAMDASFEKLAKRTGCFYSRYSDDISISTSAKVFPRSLATRVGGITTIGAEVEKVLSEAGFRPNLTKVRLFSRSRRQDVTGLTTNEFVNVNRTFVRQIRAMLHAGEKFGLAAAEAQFHSRHDKRYRAPGRRRPDFVEVVAGKLAFLAMIRGRDDRLFSSLVARARNLDARFGSILTRDDAVLLLERDLSAVVLDGVEAQGTGFLLADVGLVSAAHVIADVSGTGLSEMYAHRTPGGDRARISSTLCDPALDIAVCPAPFPRLPALRAGNPDHVRVGDELTLLGFPHWTGQGGLKTTTARVVGRARTNGFDRIELDLPINRGNSGGPVLNVRGEVIGIAVTGSPDASHANRIVPINVIPARAQQLGISLPAIAPDDTAAGGD